MKIWKLTPFAIAYPLSILLFILYFKLGVWTSFSLLFIIIFIIAVSLIFLIERLIIKNAKSRTVWKVESIILLSIIILCLSFFVFR